MIDQADVVTMRVPFPQIESSLAVKAHMYVCVQNGTHKKFIKCQTFKPLHIAKTKPPYQYLIEPANIKRNPFMNKTTIDCDKAFCLDNVTIDKSLLTKRRKDVCEDLFGEIQEKTEHVAFLEELLDSSHFLYLNKKAQSSV